MLVDKIPPITFLVKFFRGFSLEVFTEKLTNACPKPNLNQFSRQVWYWVYERVDLENAVVLSCSSQFLPGGQSDAVLLTGS